MIKTVTAQSGSYQYVFEMSASADAGALIFDIAGIAEHSKEITVDKLSTRTVISGVAPKQRIVTLSIRILATDVEGERKTLRQVFAEGNQVSLSFETDLVPVRTITGTVESCNNPIFVKESLMIVTMICPDSTFYAEEVTLSLITDTEDPMRQYVDDEINPGDAVSGCCLSIILDGTVVTGTAMISHQVTDPPMLIDMEKVDQLVGGIQDGDIIVVDSGYRKRCILTRLTETYNIFSAVGIPYSWIKMVNGTINISVVGFGGSSSIKYLPGYGGI